MKKLIYILAALALLLIPSHAGAQAGGEYTVIRSRASAPATCSPSEGGIYWDTVAREFKECSDVNTWTPVVPSLVLPQSEPSTAHEWLNSYDASTGLFTASRPDYSDLTGLPVLASSKAATAHQWLSSYDAATGLFSSSQPGFADIRGIAGTSQLPFTYSGNTSKLVTAGTISGTGSTLCTDASGNATTSGCVGSGVTSLDSITGAVQLVAGSNVTITDNSPSAGQITIASSGGGGSVYPTMTPPRLADFSWVNQLDRTASDEPNRLLVTVPAGHPDPNVSLLAWNTPLSSHYTIEGAFELGGFQNQSQIQDTGGIGIRDSASGKFETFYIRVTGTQLAIFVVTWNSPTSFNTITSDMNWNVSNVLNFLKIVDDGTSRTFYYSYNGWDWFDLFSEPSGTFITPDQAVIGGFNSGATVPIFGACWDWSVF